jgi:thioredoxin reductase
MQYDVVIIGGGPAGLSAALTLGRARRQVLLCDSGPRRNAAAGAIHNFVTRDGSSPDEFRRVARDQLTQYPSVRLEELPVTAVAGTRGSFLVSVGPDTVAARRLLLCTGMTDEMLPFDGFQALWGRTIVQCPFCHGWEARDRPWGYLVTPQHAANLETFALQLRGWTDTITVFTNDAISMAPGTTARFSAAGVRVEMNRIARLIARSQHLEAIELVSGARVKCELLFAHPPQQQGAVVRALGVALDANGFVSVDPFSRQTSVPGVFAAGDLITRMQAAIAAASSGMHAASMINVDLALEAAS